MTDIGFLFDLDGVLIDSEKEYTKIWEEIDKIFPSGKQNFPLLIKGLTLSKILRDHYSKEVRPKVMELLHRMEKDMVYSYCVGALNLLDSLRKNGLKIAVVTSSDQVKMNHLYRDLPEFRSQVNVIIDSSKVKNSKPNPEGYLTAARSLNADIKKCVVIEDSVQGVKAGRKAGAFVIGITGTKSRLELEPYCDMVIDSLKEINIKDIVQRCLNR